MKLHRQRRQQGLLTFERLTIPPEIAMRNMEAGGYGLQRWAASLQDGNVLRVLAGIEPSGSNGQHVNHVSVSVAGTRQMNEEPCRLATDIEAKAALELVPTHGNWEEDNTGGSGAMRHFYDG